MYKRQLQDPDLEDEIDWAGKQCEDFAHTLARGFEQYFTDLASEQQREKPESSDPRVRFWGDISPHVDLLKVILNQLDDKLKEYSERKAG